MLYKMRRWDTRCIKTTLFSPGWSCEFTGPRCFSRNTFLYLSAAWASCEVNVERQQIHRDGYRCDHIFAFQDEPLALHLPLHSLTAQHFPLSLHNFTQFFYFYLSSSHHLELFCHFWPFYGLFLSPCIMYFLSVFLSPGPAWMGLYCTYRIFVLCSLMDVCTAINSYSQFVSCLSLAH